MPSQTATLIARARDHYRGGQVRDAHGLCVQALRADPRAAAAYGLLGEIAADHRTFDKGEDLFRRAWALAPADAAFGAGLARCLLGLNREGPALAAAERALALGSADAQVFDTLGVVFSRTGRQDLAATGFRAAHRLAPTQPGYLLNLGWAEQYLGDFAAAEAAWRRCIALDPDNDRAISALVQMVPQTADDHFTGQLRRLFAQAAGDADRQLRIGHALAKTLEDQGDAIGAFDWLVRAKAAKAGAASGLAAWQAELFAAARATAPRPITTPASPVQNAPVFIFGLPRSGTTLVERIITSHPAVVSAGEPMDLAIIARRLAGAPTRELIDGPTLRAATGGDMARLGADYVAAIRARHGNAERFTDKTPLNFLYAGLIHAALPNARMVCLRRHPIDSCLAIFRQLFATGFAYYDWVYSLEATARFYLAFEDLVAHWRATLPADRFREVAYEDVVADQAGQARALLAWLDLPWDDAALAPHENAAPVATASAAQVRRPVYASSVGRWKRYGDRLKPLTDILVAGGAISADEVEAG
ncbi:MAG: sulfotransferase [Caulobacter sp.]|nr:sulfotransferase [Caulobacter sp.]